ncbi:RHS repeat-associated core domain-containing protein, partial [Xanthomonas citri]|uniref:RHS repeat-associated core domain-containing protein n=1 Tax=Xanthomonas citri TaxID=346 RepID=UPI002FCB773A
MVERTDYQPYGSPIGKTVDGIGYTGHAMDGATGLTYMQQRYYDQDLGRFLSVDPVAADSVLAANFNRYWYA